MQELAYFSLWCNDDDYTLQTLGPDFKETILDYYVFQCTYVGHGISRLRPSAIYRYLHQICKNIYLGNMELAARMYLQFPYLNECSAQDRVIYDEFLHPFGLVSENGVEPPVAHIVGPIIDFVRKIVGHNI